MRPPFLPYALLLFSHLAWGIPISIITTQSTLNTRSFSSNNSSITQTITVLPLGDSITFGIGSNDFNSYRQFLQTRLADDGVDTDFIGSVKSGIMTDNDNEGHSGATIDQVSAFADAVLSQRPQVSQLPFRPLLRPGIHCGYLTPYFVLG
jgi:lysophospholipase L1-like esterase